MPAFQGLLGCSSGGVLNRLIVVSTPVRRPNAVAFFTPLSIRRSCRRATARGALAVCVIRASGRNAKPCRGQRAARVSHKGSFAQRQPDDSCPHPRAVRPGYVTSSRTKRNNSNSGLQARCHAHQSRFPFRRVHKEDCCNPATILDSGENSGHIHTARSREPGMSNDDPYNL